ncbi:putative glutathione transferase [Helianthus debilis subsp. tardiflorus]
MDSQDQGIYYTNLLHGNSIVSLEDSPPLPTNPISVKKSTRGVNFIPEEDKLLVSAWLNHSLDAIQGTDQKYSQLWEKIFEYFQQHKETTTERTIKSLSNRWSCIEKATNSFCSCLAQVERLNQSGMTEQDKFDKAKIMYQSEEKCNFLFEYCWNLLKDQPKWILRDATKQRKTMVPPRPQQQPHPQHEMSLKMKLSNWIDQWVRKLL